ncbi:MAG TPA: hypothetical protein VKT72_12050 [Candidatus Baltobacteraceae bacterium]|nr:hypothetical protein [Candidatus Baltobacteraceae bacterium]
MRSLAGLTFCFCLLLAAFPQSAAAAIPGLDQCTVVAVQMLDTVDSSDARPGDFFRFETINAVTSGKDVVIPARTMGYGVVSVASPAGRNGHAGTLVLEPLYFVMPNGGHVGVVLDHNASDLQRSGTSGNMPGYLGAIPVPGLGAAIGIFNYFHHGRDIEVKRGTPFAVFPSNAPTSERCQDNPQL